MKKITYNAKKDVFTTITYATVDYTVVSNKQAFQSLLHLGLLRNSRDELEKKKTTATEQGDVYTTDVLTAKIDELNIELHKNLKAYSVLDRLYKKDLFLKMILCNNYRCNIDLTDFEKAFNEELYIHFAAAGKALITSEKNYFNSKEYGELKNKVCDFMHRHFKDFSDMGLYTVGKFEFKPQHLKMLTAKAVPSLKKGTTITEYNKGKKELFNQFTLAILNKLAVDKVDHSKLAEELEKYAVITEEEKNTLKTNIEKSTSGEKVTA